MQVHDPEYCPDVNLIVTQVLPALAEAKRNGKIKMIGMTGYPLSIHKAVAEANKVQGGPRVDTVLSYCHYSLNDSSLVDDWFPFIKEQKLGLINASPISMGLLSNRGPPSWHPAQANIKEACAAAAAFCREQDIDISALAMWYGLHSRKDIPTTLVSTASMANLQKNIDSVSANTLGEKETRALEDLMQRFMRPLQNQTWEGIEIEEYKVLVKKAEAGEATGTLSTNK